MLDPSVSLALVSFVFVALRAVQQLNVVHDRWAWVIPTSAIMAMCEMSQLQNAIKSGWWSWVPLWLGGSTGCLLAMWAHRRARSGKGRGKAKC